MRLYKQHKQRLTFRKDANCTYIGELAAILADSSAHFANGKDSVNGKNESNNRIV